MIFINNKSFFFIFFLLKFTYALNKFFHLINLFIFLRLQKCVDSHLSGRKRGSFPTLFIPLSAAAGARRFFTCMAGNEAAFLIFYFLVGGSRSVSSLFPSAALLYPFCVKSSRSSSYMGSSSVRGLASMLFRISMISLAHWSGPLSSG